jgi:hypothetical protein
VTEELPPDITEGATLRGDEFAWSVSSFPNALVRAAKRGYACLGGQFQFRLDDGSTCEMYWLGADSTARRNGESWLAYVHRSCSEVLAGFQQMASQTDFAKEARGWPIDIDPAKHLAFVAYFVTETDLAARTNS